MPSFECGASQCDNPVGASSAQVFSVMFVVSCIPRNPGHHAGPGHHVMCLRSPAPKKMVICRVPSWSYHWTAPIFHSGQRVWSAYLHLEPQNFFFKASEGHSTQLTSSLGFFFCN